MEDIVSIASKTDQVSEKFPIRLDKTNFRVFRTSAHYRELTTTCTISCRQIDTLAFLFRTGDQAICPACIINQVVETRSLETLTGPFFGIGNRAKSPYGAFWCSGSSSIWIAKSGFKPRSQATIHQKPTNRMFLKLATHKPVSHILTETK
jgi:hypothetical protein